MSFGRVTYYRLSFQRSVLHAMWRQILPKFFLHRGFVIRPVADVHPGNGITFEDNEMGADAVKEPGKSILRFRCLYNFNRQAG